MDQFIQYTPTEVVFGKTDDYADEIIGIEPINVDVKRKGKIKLYVNGMKAYILSDRKISRRRLW